MCGIDNDIIEEKLNHDITDTDRWLLAKWPSSSDLTKPMLWKRYGSNGNDIIIEANLNDDPLWRD